MEEPQSAGGRGGKGAVVPVRMAVAVLWLGDGTDARYPNSWPWDTLFCQGFGLSCFCCRLTCARTARFVQLGACILVGRSLLAKIPGLEDDYSASVPLSCT